MLKEMDKIIVKSAQRGNVELSDTFLNTVNQEQKYLGKKKTAQSILEEKRMLEEMDRIVKQRLRALEAIEKEDAGTNVKSVCCGCEFFSS
jgi:hypothetical protein